jgi:hypothetical protein
LATAVSLQEDSAQIPYGTAMHAPQYYESSTPKELPIVTLSKFIKPLYDLTDQPELSKDFACCPSQSARHQITRNTKVLQTDFWRLKQL